MTRDHLFSQLWLQYSEQNPIVKKVHNSFTRLGETVINDHIAFRTFNDERIGIDVLAQAFKAFGYQKKAEYFFEEKKLRAAHYEIPNSKNEPKVFISELLLDEFSQDLQSIVNNLLNKVDNKIYLESDLILQGNIWGLPSHETYHKLRQESEYAAWLYVFGFRANHFTVSINHLKHLPTIEETNKYLKDNGYYLNTAGGEIKGDKAELLQQSSILADNVKVVFSEGTFEIPGCYYEFAMRYNDEKGNLFNGFIAKNANRIFESTNYKK